LTYASFTSFAPRLLVASAASFWLATACTAASTTASVDAAVPSPAPGPADAGYPPTDASLAESPSCTPADVSGLQPVWHRPSAFHQGVCSEAQLADFRDKCLSKGTLAACAGVVPAACAGCIATDDAAERWGPLVVHKGWAELNISGCLANAMNDPTGVICAASVQAASACELKACAANCPVSDTGSYASYDACRAQADSAGCSGFASDAQCIQELHDAGAEVASCTSGLSGVPFAEQFIDIAKLFCAGTPAGDAGPNPSDAGGGPG
jgi:hypothetical protein